MPLKENNVPLDTIYLMTDGKTTEITLEPVEISDADLDDLITPVCINLGQVIICTCRFKDGLPFLTMSLNKKLLKEKLSLLNRRQRRIRKQKRQIEKERRRRLKNGGSTHGKKETR